VSLSLADIRQLPYPNDTFDFAISVAAYHHIERMADRQKALSELRRILKPGGEAFITVWNRWQPRFWFKHSDISVPWRKKCQTLYRYYHLFTYAELEKLVKRAGFQVIRSFPESSYHFPIKSFSRNICLLLEKSG
jgi:SAM-dependent methyltransferase